jgi:hypothetical protein
MSDETADELMDTSPALNILPEKPTKTEKIKKEKVFICLGETGHGKSTFINYMYNYMNGELNIDKIKLNPSLIKLAIPVNNYVENVAHEYKTNENELNIGNEFLSHTRDCKEYVIETELSAIKLIDTPGFNSTEESNSVNQIFEKISNVCLDYDFLNGVILFINGSCPRLQPSIKNFITHLLNFLSNEISKSIILILTNTDEASCNIQQELLSDLNKLNSNPKWFFMQNSLFRWNKSELNKRQWRDLSQNWIDSCDTTKEIILEITKYSPVSTQYFHSVKIKSKQIFKEIKKEIKRIYYLIDRFNEIEIKNIAILKAKAVMQTNQNRSNNFEIDAIPLLSDQSLKNQDFKEKKPRFKKFQNFLKKVKSRSLSSFSNLVDDAQSLNLEENSNQDSFLRSKETLSQSEISLKKENLKDRKENFSRLVENKNSKSNENIKTIEKKNENQKFIKITVKIDNNEAINQFNNAEYQETAAIESIARLTDDIYKIKDEINFAFAAIQSRIDEVKSMCKGFNFLQFFYPMLKEFELKANNSKFESDLVIQYYNMLYQIIENAIKF